MNPSLDPIFRPRSVAVVGASPRQESLGWHLLDKILGIGFTGRIHPIHPRAESIHDLRAWRSVSLVPEEVDLAVLLVPKEQVADVVRDCAAKRVRGIVVVTAGFREIGGEGVERERELADLVRSNGMRMIGPNCMGVINTEPAISLDATFGPLPALPGNVGFASQSGALGVAILNAAASLGIGFTQFASIGNKTDVSEVDLLEFWEDDPATRVIALYLESLADPKRFAEVARRVGRKKPIVAVKSGRTNAGAAAASSHTGALAGEDVAISALFEQCGVLRAETLDDLFLLLTALTRCPIPAPDAGRRVGILTNAGGPGILAADACVRLGLPLATLSEETKTTLRSFLPVEATVANPTDMIATADVATYARALEAFVADPETESVLLINVTPGFFDPMDIVRASTPVAVASGKPVVAVMMSKEGFYSSVHSIENHPPIYRFPEPAAKALAALFRYGAWRGRSDGPPPRFDTDEVGAQQLLDRVSARGGGFLTPDESFSLLALHGFPVARAETAGNRGELIAAGRRLGYPVVLKAWGAALVHKSDLGAVAVGLSDEASLTAAFDAMTARLRVSGQLAAKGPSGRSGCSGFLVQEQVEGGRELILGIATDPQIGPLLMVGLGGKYVEIFGDVRFRIPPISPFDARSMIRELAGFRILEGVRGESPADLEMLEEMLLRLSALAVRHPEIVELDVNPLLLGRDRSGTRVVDARIRVKRSASGPTSPSVRRTRSRSGRS
jgi:acetyltransferase